MKRRPAVLVLLVHPGPVLYEEPHHHQVVVQHRLKVLSESGLERLQTGSSRLNEVQRNAIILSSGHYERNKVSDKGSLINQAFLWHRQEVEGLSLGIEMKLFTRTKISAVRKWEPVNQPTKRVLYFASFTKELYSPSHIPDCN